MAAAEDALPHEVILSISQSFLLVALSESKSHHVLNDSRKTFARKDLDYFMICWNSVQSCLHSISRENLHPEYLNKLVPIHIWKASLL